MGERSSIPQAWVSYLRRGMERYGEVWRGDREERTEKGRRRDRGDEMRRWVSGISPTVVYSSRNIESEK
jgi:hypothetical protein